MSGANFEERLKVSCAQYKQLGIALIHKIPTPWSVTYDKYKRRVLSAYPLEKSSVDFEGVWQGRSIAFEAKSTMERNRFDLKNVKQHQLDYLHLHEKQGGISFFIIEFSKLGEVFLVKYNHMQKWFVSSQSGGRKSIPYNWFQANCAKVLPGRTTLDFIKILEKELPLCSFENEKG